jgi:hypothetical protein
MTVWGPLVKCFYCGTDNENSWMIIIYPDAVIHQCTACKREFRFETPYTAVEIIREHSKEE